MVKPTVVEGSVISTTTPQFELNNETGAIVELAADGLLLEIEHNNIVNFKIFLIISVLIKLTLV